MQSRKPLNLPMPENENLSSIARNQDYRRLGCTLDLPSKHLIVSHILIVQTVMGVLQANLRDLNNLRKRTFAKENLLIILSISNHREILRPGFILAQIKELNQSLN